MGTSSIIVGWLVISCTDHQSCKVCMREACSTHACSFIIVSYILVSRLGDGAMNAPMWCMSSSMYIYIQAS